VFNSPQCGQVPLQNPFDIAIRRRVGSASPTATLLMTAPSRKTIRMPIRRTRRIRACSTTGSDAHRRGRRREWQGEPLQSKSAPASHLALACPITCFHRKVIPPFQARKKVELHHGLLANREILKVAHYPELPSLDRRDRFSRQLRGVFRGSLGVRRFICRQGRARRRFVRLCAERCHKRNV
jgi:hypothetical protein